MLDIREIFKTMSEFTNGKMSFHETINGKPYKLTIYWVPYGVGVPPVLRIDVKEAK